MARPYRPNPYTGARKRDPGESAEQQQRPWRKTHVKQETRAEAKARKRREAEQRADALAKAVQS